MKKNVSSAREEYRRRIDLCVNAISRASKALKLDGGVTGEFQGCEIHIKNDKGVEAMVIVLMMTGHPPRLPKYTTLEVHGCIFHNINSRLHLHGGSLGASKKKFLPDRISIEWLKKSIANSANEIRKVLSDENWKEIVKQALTKRRQECKTGNLPARYIRTSFDLNSDFHKEEKRGK